MYPYSNADVEVEDYQVALHSSANMIKIRHLNVRKTITLDLAHCIINSQRGLIEKKTKSNWI